MQWGSTTTKRVLTIAKVISLVFLVAVILLVIASTLLIANTIRLSIFARRREIEVMKLVGATNWFIRGPFMLEGLLCGLVGSVLAVILLVLGKTIALPAILPHLGGGNSRRPRAAVRAERARADRRRASCLGAMGSGLDPPPLPPGLVAAGAAEAPQPERAASAAARTGAEARLRADRPPARAARRAGDGDRAPRPDELGQDARRAPLPRRERAAASTRRRCGCSRRRRTGGSRRSSATSASGS